MLILRTITVIMIAMKKFIEADTVLRVRVMRIWRSHEGQATGFPGPGKKIRFRCIEAGMEKRGMASCSVF